MSRLLAVALASSLLACVAQVRGSRIQRPLHDAPDGSRIALVSVEVPSWVAEATPRGQDAREQIKAAALAAFEKGPYVLVDATAAGYRIPMGPDTRPTLATSANVIAEVNKPWAFDADGIADAVGAPPIGWRVAKAPPGFEIDATSGRVTWTPANLGKHGIELVASNKHGDSSFKFEVEVVAQGGAPEVKLGKPNGFVSGPYASVLPGPVPDTIDAPLVLGIRVAGWSGDLKAATTRQKIVVTDVVYALWTRDGKELETRRVIVNQMPAVSYQNAVTFEPDRDATWKWKESWDVPLPYAPVTTNEMFPSAARANAVAFAYAWTKQEIAFSAQLDESSPALKPGIELSNKDDYQGAYKAFEAAAQADPKLAGAWYNMGVMKELLGFDAEALELYRKAYGLNPNEPQGMYKRQMFYVEKRLEQKQALGAPAPSRELQ